ncbi:MAG: CvpA family protein [Actinomycetota bacterium]|nr:CvpA family protein [Actinomycetota bacterium]
MQRGLVVDALVATILLFALYRGWRHGSLREMAGLLGLAAGILVAPLLVGPLAALLERVSALQLNVARLIALLATIAVVELVVVVIAIRKTRGIQISGPRWLDGSGGVVIATFRAITIASLFLYGMLAVSAGNRDLPGFTEAVITSASGGVLAEPSSPFTSFYDGLIARSDDLRALTLWVRQQTRFRESVPTDSVRFTAATEGLAVDHAAERRLLELMNDERVAQGLEPLRWCEACADVARGHSRDMYEEGYFSHVDAAGRDPFERMRKANIRYAAAGENLAIAPSVVEAHEGLLASPDHRANILRSEFDEVGIGIYDGPYGLMCTEVFRTSP